MGVAEMVGKALEEQPDADPQDVARALWPRVKREMLYPLFVGEIRRMQRDAMRTGAERAFHKAFFAQRDETAVITVNADDAVGRFRVLFGKTLAIGNEKTRVLVEQMTREQWLARREMLAGNIRGLQRDVAICDEALRVLDETGAPTLGEVVDVAA